MSSSGPPFATALVAGGLAGTTVDLSLFPLDTLKTRLQSRAGFFPSGGFSGIYRGVGSAIVGSSPGAAFFFCTYEGTKSFLKSQRPTSASGAAGTVSKTREAAEHMMAGSLGEIAACSIRVPTEVIKQRAQAGQHSGSSLQALKSILSLRQTEAGLAGVWRELYRGWGITVIREVPFTVIQFPLWERMKAWGRARRAAASGTESEQDVGAVESALYGSLAGAISAAATTPLDVLKTRIMLSEKKVKMGHVFRTVLREEGGKAFFAGLTPRVTWISIGGAIFLGSYQFVVNTLQAGITA